MRFNRFSHLIAFSGKAHRRSPAFGRVITKMPDTNAPSQAKRRTDFGPYIPLSGNWKRKSAGFAINSVATSITSRRPGILLSRRRDRLRSGFGILRPRQTDKIIDSKDT